MKEKKRKVKVFLPFDEKKWPETSFELYPLTFNDLLKCKTSFTVSMS